MTYPSRNFAAAKIQNRVKPDIQRRANEQYIVASINGVDLFFIDVDGFDWRLDKVLDRIRKLMKEYQVSPGSFIAIGSQDRYTGIMKCEINDKLISLGVSFYSCENGTFEQSAEHQAYEICEILTSPYSQMKSVSSEGIGNDISKQLLGNVANEFEEEGVDCSEEYKHDDKSEERLRAWMAEAQNGEDFWDRID